MVRFPPGSLLPTEFPKNHCRRLLWPVEATDLDMLVVVIRSFIDIADSSALQEDVREFVNEPEDLSSRK